MKKTLLLIAIFSTLASCKKEKNPQITPGLFGKWELAYVHGGWHPATAVTNSGNVYQFNSDSTYVKYLDNKVTASGKFSIKINQVQDTIKFGLITFTNPTYSDAWAQTPHTIIIGSSAADGPSYEYHKVSYK
ncbi:hypothetical protein [Mucilaginibacter psychrotolerans]|uniref:Lipocalin-like domain-containing protein n=1 Tax=Mucilaginibacter psychrotolerans TaxID=1524096 RepID=A0A4Y8SDB4_9SPHI|nr:hypothetical protein [Mucilaginibacter psychrotolerans]TFF36902.1 hypothetical protein E2R66_14170 [Mucilaginibacter psychrotolerans]